MLSNTASMVPFINHNQAPRNYYQISMCKQALGANMHRGANKELIFPIDPIVKCSMQDMLGMNGRGTGQTLQMAMMCRPNNSEDGVVVKKEFIERGGLMMQVRFRYKATFKEVNEPNEILEKANDQYTTIEDNGLPRINDVIAQSECVIGKLTSNKDDSVKMSCGEEAAVYDVMVTTLNKTTTVIVDLRVVRNQVEGDKVSPRNAQKCTISEISNEYVLPRVLHLGWSPDIYVNSHCLTGRVTVSYEFMIKSGAIGSRLGEFLSGDPGSFADIHKHLATLGNTKYEMHVRLSDSRFFLNKK